MFKIKHNITRVLVVAFVNIKRFCPVISADVCCVFPFSSRWRIRHDNPFSKLLKEKIFCNALTLLGCYFSMSQLGCRVTGWALVIVGTGWRFLSGIRSYWDLPSLQTLCIRLSVEVDSPPPPPFTVKKLFIHIRGAEHFDHAQPRRLSIGILIAASKNESCHSVWEKFFCSGWYHVENWLMAFAENVWVFAVFVFNGKSDNLIAFS